MKPTGHTTLYTGDCNAHVYNPEMWQPEGGRYTATAIHRFVDRLAESGVDTYLVNPNAMVAWYPSRACPTILDGYRRGDRAFWAPQLVGRGGTPEQKERQLDHLVRMADLYLDLAEDGVDWVAEACAACRRGGISPWLSIRMNDMHGHTNPESPFNPPLYRDPANRLSGIHVDPRQGPAKVLAGLNYAVPVVRDFYFAQLRELVEEYDFEGLELDWTRHPLCCEPPATDAQREIMIEWIARVRALTRARAERTGRPYWLGLRVSARLGTVREMGIDVPALVRRDLVDFVGFANGWLTTWDVPFDRLRADLGDSVALYGQMDDAPNDVRGMIPETGQVGYRYLSASAELMRGNAASHLARGADGVEMFNFFCTDSQRTWYDGAIPGLFSDYGAFRGLGDLAFLRQLPKHYCLQGMHLYSEPWPNFEQPAQLPVYLEGGWRHSFHLSMCAEPQNGGRRLVAQLVFERTDGTPALGISLNDTWPRFDGTLTAQLIFPTGPFREHAPENAALEFVLDPALIREGLNEIVVYNETPAEGRGTAVKLVSVELGIR